MSNDRRISLFCGLLAAGALSLAYLLPVYRTEGTSMQPTLKNGSILIFKRTKHPKRGDIAAFRHEGRVIVKRVAAVSGDTVDISPEGAVIVNGTIQIEPYVSCLYRGSCDAPLPMTIPENFFFMLGDERVSSIDSRSGRLGLIDRKSIIGTLFCTI
ncbi:MAG: signal peptidase I [Ruminococcus sp.]|nr:signal peptidase I [Ruminococcus sp.]